MTDPRPSIESMLDRYRGEVERWNRQINLITRQGAAGALENLVEQSVAGYEAMQAAVGAAVPNPAHVAYLDLGSGGGLPGFVWHCLLSGSGVEHESRMVEPREKRAWFLERLPAVTGAPPWSVAASRWGESEHHFTLARPDTILLSLKALHLEDRELLAGLPGLDFDGDPAGPGTVVALVRFVPPGSQWADLAKKTGENRPGSEVVHAGQRFETLGGSVVADERLFSTGAALSLSLYRTLP